MFNKMIIKLIDLTGKHFTTGRRYIDLSEIERLEQMNLPVAPVIKRLRLYTLGEKTCQR